MKFRDQKRIMDRESLVRQLLVAQEHLLERVVGIGESLSMVDSSCYVLRVRIEQLNEWLLNDGDWWRRQFIAELLLNITEANSAGTSDGGASNRSARNKEHPRKAFRPQLKSRQHYAYRRKYRNMPRKEYRCGDSHEFLEGR